MSLFLRIATLAPLLALGCAGSLEKQSHQQIDYRESELGFVTTQPAQPELGFDGTFNGYLAVALKQSPTARASFERWRSATLSIAKTRRLPEPTVGFGYFIRSVETRVGPQRFRINLSQTFPWPSKLSAGSDAAAERARAAQSLFDAELIAIRRRVAAAYWNLWLIHEEHRLKSEHDAVLEALAGAVRGRLTTGAASLADLNQIELTIARHHDHRGQHLEAGRKASAKLLAAIGVAGDGQSLEATDHPISGLPSTADRDLRDAARAHPHIEKFAHLAASQGHRARAERADRFPRLRLGLDYIATGESTMPSVPDSGKDAVIVSAGIAVPLWFGSYGDSEDAARAAANAFEADREAAVRNAEAALDTALAMVRDSERRIELYDKTLVPQAETTFQAVLGGYQTGRSTVAAVILAQRDLLELQLERARARADHVTAWAELEYAVGREVTIAGGTP